MGPPSCTLPQNKLIRTNSQNNDPEATSAAFFGMPLSHSARAPNAPIAPDTVGTYMSSLVHGRECGKTETILVPPVVVDRVPREQKIVIGAGIFGFSYCTQVHVSAVCSTTRTSTAAAVYQVRVKRYSRQHDVHNWTPILSFAPVDAWRRTLNFIPTSRQTSRSSLVSM